MLHLTSQEWEEGARVAVPPRHALRQMAANHPPAFFAISVQSHDPPRAIPVAWKRVAEGV